MPDITYPATYRDQYGEESILIHNDGKDLRTTIRGVEFSGIDFDGLEPINLELAQAGRFAISPFNHLRNMVITCDMPILVAINDSAVTAILQIEIDLLEFESKLINDKFLTLKLIIEDNKYSTLNRYNFFEHALLDLHKLLPLNYFILACINCAFSDYSVYGNGSFGSMLCFRKNKEVYLQVKNKPEFTLIMDTFEEQVQETYLCPEFERRVPGTGYRG